MPGQTPETLLAQAYNSAKLKKLAVILVIAGILICIIPLLPPVQNALFSFVDARISRKGSGGAFNSRLMSLLSLPFFGLLVFVFAFCCLFSKAVTAFLNNVKNKRLIVIVTAAINVLLLGFGSVFAYRHGWQWLNSDHSAEMILGELLAEENTFVSRNWHYSTEIRLIYQTIFTMPLFKLFGGLENWALIRALTIFFNNLVLLLSYLYLARQLKIQAKWIGITCCFLILPVSSSYWDIVLFGGYYTFFIAQLFFCLGLFIRLANYDGTIKKALPDFILFTLLSFVLGLQGIRSLLCVHIPLCIACIYYYSKPVQKEKSSLPPPLFLGCYGFIICCIGFAANYLLHFRYSFHSFDNMRMANLWEEFLPKLGQSIVALPGFFGLSAGNSLLSARGLLGVAAIIGTLLLFMGVSKAFRQIQIRDNSTDKPIKNKFLPVFFLVSVIFNIFVFIIVDEGINPRYFIPFMALYIPLAAFLFEHAEKAYGHTKRMAVVSAIVLFIFGQGYLNFQNWAGYNRNTVRQGYIRYLLENQLTYGFATVPNSCVTTELANGKVKLAGLASDGLNPDSNERFQFHNWLNPVKYSNPLFHQGESFLLLSRVEWEWAQAAERPFTRLRPDYQDNNFIIIRFSSAEIIHREVLD